MLNIPVYSRYNGEKRIALLDNSAISFMLQLDNKGHHPESLLQDYDIIFLPGWVVEEIRDSEFRSKYMEKLVNAGFPICIINENMYSDLMEGEEIYLFDIVKATVSRLGVFLKYLRLFVEKKDPLDMEPYEKWIQNMYNNWPRPEECTVEGRTKKKNAGEISITILSEIFSWHYQNAEVLTIYTQDADTYVFQKCAEDELKKIFKDKTPISVTYRSNDAIMCQMYRNNQLSLEEINIIRKDARSVTYTIERADKSVAMETKTLGNEEFLKLVQDSSMQIIF